MVRWVHATTWQHPCAWEGSHRPRASREQHTLLGIDRYGNGAQPNEWIRRWVELIIRDDRARGIGALRTLVT